MIITTKYKICPNCQTKNEPTDWECSLCETDLTRVCITDEETEKTHDAHKEEHSVEQITLVKVCDCGTKNLSNARKCSACDEDISDITPTPEAEAIKPQTINYVLGSLDGQFSYQLSKNEISIGRTCVMGNYLSSKKYVSRAHAKLTIENDALYIQNLNSTNFTYVNHQRMDEKTQLKDGDEIGLGGTGTDGVYQEEAAYFCVRILSCM